MSNAIADEMKGQDEKAILSTTLVMLSGGTAMMGLVLILMGRFRIADAVSYLPLPVVGGYLAFIGYFCLQAGVSLCISESMMKFKDWAYMLQPDLFLLALPGLLAGVVMTLASHSIRSNVILPTVMLIIPLLFYVVIFTVGWGLDGAREYKLISEESEPVPVKDLFHLIEFDLINWSMVSKVFPIWIGMVFVVSFASCLDVAAISMDMGEALDTNKELATVGIANLMSGLTCGFTGSYIFSQTIFTFRTQCHSRWVGILVMVAYICVVWSEKSLLEFVPLFFLGSTLIFIGYDLLYEWIIEVRHKLIWSEYLVLLFTFAAIHVVGMDFGIILGIIVAIMDYVMTTAQTSSINRINKRSRAVWQPDDWKLLQNYGYGENAKIITLEVRGSVFFGSSVQLLSFISEEIGLDGSDEDLMDMSLLSPHMGAHLLRNKTGTPISTPKTRRKEKESLSNSKLNVRHRPDFLVLDLSQVTNLDATAARGCFLQLAKMCAKRGIIVCASGLHPRIDWMLRSHDVAHSQDEEEKIKKSIHQNAQSGYLYENENLEKLFLFMSVYEGLEFCENIWIERFKTRSSSPLNSMGVRKKSFVRLDDLESPGDLSVATKQSLSHVFSYILGLDQNDRILLDDMEQSDKGSFHQELSLHEGDVIFKKGSTPDAFFVVLRGNVALTGRISSKTLLKENIISGAGHVRFKQKNDQTGPSTSTNNLNDTIKNDSDSLSGLKTYVRVGGIFSFVDFILERPRTFGAIAAVEKTVVARFSRARLESMKAENPEVSRIIQNVLLQASVLELANCTCSE
eukprot:CAMPEP_0197835464 /NCGR_PEP_ID=MMETSP1437-20131217/25812_1 /TAXON_ID=49252 ORGANISM="Eucampia antarctica, Strain CCMP1452" /NCGR_SAMPLE_ID=MMETSP1437 /ASSEMBLY_ACC=CAM_ASM_001096 /LENGTH=795 /DNA_ID=CAMNT_0043440917 /DNA_START=504 /DNA_END=2891 /DNA_ORIENTATION=+